MFVSNRSNVTAYRPGRALLARLRGNVRGAAAIEFAFIAAPLAALMVAILQTTLVFFAQQTLETTAEKSVRQLMTGQAQQNNMTKATFKTLVCSKLPSFMKCANVIVDVQSATSFSNIATSRPQLTFDASGNINNNWKFEPGGAGTINIVRIMYVWDVQNGPLGYDLSTMSNGRRLLYTTSVFKTEPYA